MMVRNENVAQQGFNAGKYTPEFLLSNGMPFDMVAELP